MENKKRTFMEDLKMILKGISIWQKITPSYVPYLILDCIFTCLRPYFPLYMSAEIVNELAGTCDLRRLLILAGIAVAGSFALSLLSRFSHGKLEAIYPEGIKLYDLTEGKLEIPIEELGNYAFNTNSTKISLKVKGDQDFEGSFTLFG